MAAGRRIVPVNGQGYILPIFPIFPPLPILPILPPLWALPPLVAPPILPPILPPLDAPAILPPLCALLAVCDFPLVVPPPVCATAKLEPTNSRQRTTSNFFMTISLRGKSTLRAQ